MKTNNECREALKTCIDELCNRCRANAGSHGNPLPCLTGCDVVRKAKAALASKPRNCDVATEAEAVESLKRALPTEGLSEDERNIISAIIMDIVRALYAPYTEGETK